MLQLYSDQKRESEKYEFLQGLQGYFKVTEMKVKQYTILILYNWQDTEDSVLLLSCCQAASQCCQKIKVHEHSLEEVRLDKSKVLFGCRRRLENFPRIILIYSLDVVSKNVSI